MGDKKLGVHEDGEELIKRSYSEPTGLRMTEYKSFASESDFSNGNWKRESPDNGRTWGDWTDVYGEVFQYVDGTDADEILWCNRDPDLYDPKSGRFVTCGMQRYFIGGHVEAYRKEWSEGGDDARDHCYLISQKPGEEAEYQLLRFEECDEYDSELVQLSNFSLLENRETLKLEIRLARIGMHSIPGEGHDLYSETWLYEIDFPV